MQQTCIIYLSHVVLSLKKEKNKRELRDDIYISKIKIKLWYNYLIHNHISISIMKT